MELFLHAKLNCLESVQCCGRKVLADRPTRSSVWRDPLVDIAHEFAVTFPDRIADKAYGKKLDSNCTIILLFVSNKSLRQHPTKQQLCGHLPPISKTIQIKRTRHVRKRSTTSQIFIICWILGVHAKTLRRQSYLKISQKHLTIHWGKMELILLVNSLPQRNCHSHDGTL